MLARSEQEQQLPAPARIMRFMMCLNCAVCADDDHACGQHRHNKTLAVHVGLEGRSAKTITPVTTLLHINGLVRCLVTLWWLTVVLFFMDSFQFFRHCECSIAARAMVGYPFFGAEGL